MKKRPLIIVGAGGHGRVVADIAVLTGYEDISFLDDADVHGINVVGKVSGFANYTGTHDFFVAIGNNTVRKKIFATLCEAGAEMVSLIHPNAALGRNIQIGQGVAVMAGVVINNGAVIGNGAILNTCCSVDHDCEVDAFSHISVGAHLAGTVSVGVCTFVGAGATVINNIQICKEATIGAGAVVIKNIAESGTYIGVPARRL